MSEQEFKPRSPSEWAKYTKKTIAAIVGLALQLVALGVVPQEYLPWVQGVVAFLTVLGVYQVRNTTPKPSSTTSTATEDAVEQEKDIEHTQEMGEALAEDHTEGVWLGDDASALPDDETAYWMQSLIENADDVEPEGNEDGLVQAGEPGGATAFGFTSAAPVGLAARVISTAKSFVGYHEGRSGGHWNNDQQFSKHQPALRWSNFMAWCMTFVCDMFYRNGGYGPIGKPTAAVAQMRDWGKANGRFSEYPAVGAIMILGRSGVHTGICYAYDNTYAYTVEGNTNASGSREGDGVYLKRRRRADVYGWVYPKYPEGISSADPKWKGAAPKATVRTATVTPTVKPGSFGWRIVDGRPDVANYGALSVAAFNAALESGKAGADGQQHGAIREVWAVEQALDRLNLLAPEYSRDKSAGTSTQQGIDRYRDLAFPGWSGDDRRGSAGKASLNQLMHDAGIHATWS